MQLGEPELCGFVLGFAVPPGAGDVMGELLTRGTAPPTAPGPGPLSADGEMTCGKAVMAQ